MGTTAEKLQNILTAKADIGAAITEKGGAVPQTLAEYGNAIRALPSGSGEVPLTLPDPQKLYAATRDAAWPPMPEDLPEQAFAFLYAGGGFADFKVTCEGQYTVETKLCTLVDGAWSYTVEATDEIASGTAFSKEISDTETMEYRLITVTAAGITGISITSRTGASMNMRGCVEALFHVPGERVPNLSKMKQLQYVTFLGQPNMELVGTCFSACGALICIVGKLHISGSFPNCFKDCENLMAVEILSDETTGVARFTSTFEGCSKLTSLPIRNICKSRVFSTMVKNCRCLKEAVLTINTGSTNGISMQEMFQDCVSLEKVVLDGDCDLAVSGLTRTFSGCMSLRRLIFDLPNWLGSNLSVADCAFERSGLVEMFESLPAITSGKGVTVTGNPGVADLTEEDKAIVTGKGWRLITE